jgi:hypothetical protein
MGTLPDGIDCSGEAVAANRASKARSPGNFRSLRILLETNEYSFQMKQLSSCP